MNIYKNRTAILAILCVCALLPLSYAQQVNSLEQRREDKKDETIDDLRAKRGQTVDSLIAYLKQRALLKLKTQRKEMLLKTAISASASYGFDTNVTQDSSTKGDFYEEGFFSYSWQPTFNQYLGLRAGYWMLNDNYNEQTDFSFVDQALNFSLVTTPTKGGKIRIEPGIENEWLWYPKSGDSNYTNMKFFLRLRQYLGNSWQWNYGINYEYAQKNFDDAKNRDANFNVTDLTRKDTRHTAEVYLTRYWRKYNFSVRGRFYVNRSNFQYQDYYDYYSARPSITIGRVFLKDDKLYIGFSPSFERRNYMHRQAVDTTRFDNLTTWLVSALYTFKKPFTLSYQFVYRTLGSNDNTARYKTIINLLGINVDF